MSTFVRIFTREMDVFSETPVKRVSSASAPDERFTDPVLVYQYRPAVEAVWNWYCSYTVYIATWWPYVYEALYEPDVDMTRIIPGVASVGPLLLFTSHAVNVMWQGLVVHTFFFKGEVGTVTSTKTRMVMLCVYPVISITGYWLWLRLLWSCCYVHPNNMVESLAVRACHSALICFGLSSGIFTIPAILYARKRNIYLYQHGAAPQANNVFAERLYVRYWDPTSEEMYMCPICQCEMTHKHDAIVSNVRHVTPNPVFVIQRDESRHTWRRRPAKNDTVVTGCGHCYHYACLKAALANNSKCPMCQAHVNINGLYVLRGAQPHWLHALLCL